MNRTFGMLKKTIVPVAMGLVFGFGNGANAAMQTFDPLPAPNCGTTQANNCVQFGDFAVYSLALLYEQAVFAATGDLATNNPNPGDPFYVASSPGELLNDGYIVYGTGTNNAGVVTNGDGTVIDNAQSLPEGGASYITDPSTETPPTFTGDLTTSWDGTLSAIRDELGGDGDFVIYFNLNETGNDDLAGIDLLAWLHVTLVDAQNLLPTLDFYLGGTTKPDLTDLSDPNWVYVHGTICESATAGFLGFGPCTDAQVNLGGRNVNQNLGANEAAYAIFNQQLSDLVLTSDYDYLRVEGALAAINNGYEQIFSALTPVGQVPEPGTIALLGVGLLGMGYFGVRRQKG
jgi:hypothetical protein